MSCISLVYLHSQLPYLEANFYVSQSCNWMSLFAFQSNDNIAISEFLLRWPHICSRCQPHDRGPIMNQKAYPIHASTAQAPARSTTNTSSPPPPHSSSSPSFAPRHTRPLSPRSQSYALHALPAHYTPLPNSAPAFSPHFSQLRTLRIVGSIAWRRVCRWRWLCLSLSRRQRRR